LFTDIEGSTRLWEHRPDSMGVALARHDVIVRKAVAEHGGAVFSTGGDGFATAFSKPAQAAAAALELMRHLAEEPWPTDCTIRARAALHVGVADERDGDYFGPVVNRTARLISVGHGGQVLVSAAAAQLLPSVELVDLGVHRLRDLTAPEHIFQLAASGHHPPLRTLSARRHNLPLQRTELFGRDADVERIIDLLSTHRLVTLVGMGGIGKTRLALAAAAHCVDDEADGVWFVDLVPIADGLQLPEAIAAAAGLVPSGTGEAIERLCAVVNDRRILLVLDNCEHVIDSAAAVVEALLARTVGPRILVTSREPLGLVDEAQYRVAPLPTGHDDSAATDLLRSAAGRAGVRIADNDREAARELCRRLDGLPLSLELAGAQLRSLNIQALMERLDARFDLLVRRARGGTERQSSLLFVLDGTWSELSDKERLLLGRLAAFPGTFDLNAAEAVASTLPELNTTVALTRLVDLGVVSNDGVRYRILETVKLLVRQRTNHEDNDRAHADWCLRHVTAIPWSDRLISSSLLDWVCRHHDDLLAAERLFLAAGDRSAVATLIGAQCSALDTGLGGARAAGTIDRIERYLDAAMFAPGDQALLNLAASFAGRSARRPDWIVKGARQAASLFSTNGDDVGLAAALILLSWMTALRDTDGSLDLVDRAVAAAERTGSPTLLRFARLNRALPLVVALRHDEAAAELERVRPLLAVEPVDISTVFFGNYECVNDCWFDPARAGANIPVLYERESTLFASPDATLLTIAVGAASAADIGWTRRLIEESIEHTERAGSDDGLPDLLVPIALLAWRLDDVERAHRLLTAVRHAGRPTSNISTTVAYRGLRQHIGVDPSPPPDLDLAGELDDCRTWLDRLLATS
jgi:predicted ATPase